MRTGLQRVSTAVVMASALAVGAPAGAQVPQGAAMAGVRSGVALLEVITRVGFETTVVLPRAWRVVERRVGDPLRWVVTGEGHLTMVRPLAADAKTNLNLVLASGRVVSVGLRENQVLPVHTVVHLDVAGGVFAEDGAGAGAEAFREDVVAGTSGEEDAAVFVSAVDVEGIRAREARARASVELARSEAADRLADAVRAANAEAEAFEAAYPTQLHFVFEFNPEVDVGGAPYFVEGMWHDTEFTYIRFRQVLAEDIVVAGFLEDRSARVLAHEVLGVGQVIRVAGVVESGILGVGSLGAGVPWRMRGREEPWRSGR